MPKSYPHSLVDAFKSVVREGLGLQAVTIFIDDCTTHAYDVCVKVLKEYEIPATLAPQLDRIGQNGWMTWNQIRELVYEYGFDLAWHNSSSLGGADRYPAEVEYLIVYYTEYAMRMLDAEGHPSIGFYMPAIVYPGPILIPEVYKMGIIKQFFSLGFSSWWGIKGRPGYAVNAGVPIIGNYALQRLCVMNNNIENILNWLPSIMNRLDNGGWACFHNHGWDISEENFRRFLDALLRYDYPIMTVSQVLNRLAPDILLKAPYDDKIVTKIENMNVAAGEEHFNSCGLFNVEYDALGKLPVRGIGYRSYTFMVKATQPGTARIYVSDRIDGTYDLFDKFTFPANTLVTYHTTRKLPYIDFGITLNADGTIVYSRVTCSK